jgi:ABC-type transport system substrate-binding protein
MGASSFVGKVSLVAALLLVFSIALACGGTSPAEPIVVEKEVVKEVEKPVVVEKEVVKEVEKPVVVEKEVIKEVEVVKEVIKEVPIAAPLAAYFDDFPQAGKDGVPESVGKMTMVWQSWSGSDVNTWLLSTNNFLQDQYTFPLFKQHPNGELVAVWGIDWTQTEEGVTVKLHPEAKFQDGTPADAEAFKTVMLGITGDLPDLPAMGYDKGAYYQGRAKEHIARIDVIGPREVFVATPGPDPVWMWTVGGNGYQTFWYSSPTQLLKGPEAFLDNVDKAGGGPLKVVDWEPGNRMLLERWEDFWGDYPWYHKPQFEEVENILVPDHAARFALLKSKQADVAYYITYPLAKDLPKSEDYQRGVNPEKGDLWTQQYKANGMLTLDFYLPMILRESQKEQGRTDIFGTTIKTYEYPSDYIDHPTLDIRVREALSMAIDRKALSAGPHFGLSFPIGSIYHDKSIGARTEVVHTPPPFDPERAKELMIEAGYGDGFTMPGHFGQFAGRPGIIEAVDFIASGWEKYLNVTVEWKEFDPSEFVKGFGRAPEPNPIVRVPVDVKTWGRQDHSGWEARYYRPGATYIGPSTEEVEGLIYDMLRTLDPDEMDRKLAEIEDKVLALKETFPLYGMNIVWGYTDRVLAHPTVEASPHPKHVDLIVLRD